MISTKIKEKKHKVFIGIDVSKNKLDFAVIKDKEVLLRETKLNEPKVISDYLKELKLKLKIKPSTTLFCMEQTGLYVNHLISILWKNKWQFNVGNARHIKNSMGLVRGKDDQIDAVRIAKFAQRNKDELTLWKPERLEMSRLKSLVSLRSRLMGIRNSLKMPIADIMTFTSKPIQRQSVEACAKSLEALQDDLREVELQLKKLLRDDKDFSRLMEIITSVPCVGMVMAVQFVMVTNEFKDITEHRKFACYAGVAPFKNESGKIVRRLKVSQQANKKVKALLHMCAIGSVRADQEIREYFIRKKKEGKPGMLILNAIRNKIIKRVFACVKQDRLYDPDLAIKNNYLVNQNQSL
ncbi:IS110 family transposase [Mucilaginibacter lutimaris]|uniref:IS110 family transposase n=1 Tax=Mucilaginibacter lutimaris TaxID=931629 RepID=A0ABW2ZGR7_9SPHI